MNFNLKIRAKLMLSFGLMALLMFIVGIIAFFSINNIVRNMNEIGKVRMPSVRTLLVISEA